MVDDEYEALKVILRNESLRRQQSGASPARSRSTGRQSPARSRSRRSSTSPARSLAMVMNNEYEPVMVFTKNESFRRRQRSSPGNDQSSLERFIGARPVKSRSFKTTNSKEKMIRSRSSKSNRSKNIKSASKEASAKSKSSSRVKEMPETREADVTTSWLCGVMRDDGPSGGGCCGPSDDLRKAPEIKKDSSWFCPAPEEDLKYREERNYREDIPSPYVDYLGKVENSFNSYLDDADDDESDEEDEMDESTFGESVPSTVFIPNTMVQRLKLRGSNLRPKFLRKKKSKSRRILSDTSSFNNSTLPSKEDMTSYKKEKRSKSKPKLSTSLNRLNCVNGIPDGVDLRDELNEATYKYSQSSNRDPAPSLPRNSSLKQSSYPMPKHRDINADMDLVNNHSHCSFLESHHEPQHEIIHYSDDEIRVDPLCFGLGGDRLICMPEAEPHHEIVPRRPRSIGSSSQYDKRTRSSLEKIKRKVQRVRSGSQKYVI